jgi:AcrR family transcriptional regulator
MRAAIDLVTERGTAVVSISDIAETADVSRPVVYQHFGDRETLLLEAALDLAERELLPGISGTASADPREHALAVARHFADHRACYRAMLMSSSGFALNSSLSALLIPVNRQLVEPLSGLTLDPQGAEDLATFLTGGVAALVNMWVVEGADPLDPEVFTDRLMRMMPIATAGLRQPQTTRDTEPDE